VLPEPALSVSCPAVRSEVDHVAAGGVRPLT
jgi:hypothetical protein